MTTSTTYKKSVEYLECLNNFCNLLTNKAKKGKDDKLKYICTMIINYLFTSLHYEKLNIKSLKLSDDFVMSPFYEYIDSNNIQLYDLKNIEMDDVDIQNDFDIERFILSHIHYIYSQK
jgi:hypothetical protein